MQCKFFDNTKSLKLTTPLTMVKYALQQMYGLNDASRKGLEYQKRELMLSKDIIKKSRKNIIFWGFHRIVQNLLFIVKGKRKHFFFYDQLILSFLVFTFSPNHFYMAFLSHISFPFSLKTTSLVIFQMQLCSMQICCLSILLFLKNGFFCGSH